MTSERLDASTKPATAELQSGSELCSSDLLERKIQIALKRISSAIEATKPIAVFGLFSGGHDSVTATTIASLHPRFTSAVHINTGIGIARTRQYVRETSAMKSWPLAEYEAAKNVNGKGKPDPQIYRELVLKLGFPGPHGHGMMYARLKERCLRMLQREWKASGRKTRPRRVMYISGCRSDESLRRMANTKEVQVDGQRIWCAPIHDWTKSDCHALMEAYSVPRNPVVDLIHKSGECLCGAFAQKGELEELKLWPETRDAYDEIMSIQAEVIAAGLPWGWEDAPPAWYQEKKAGQSFLMNYDQHLCWSCNKAHELLKANIARGQSVTTPNGQRSKPTRAGGDGVTQTPLLRSNDQAEARREHPMSMDTEQANELRKLAVASSGLLDRVVARLDEAEGKNRGYEKMQRDYIVKIARHYHRQLQTCDDLLTKQGVPEWVENSDSNGVPGNAVIERLKWYLARRKDVKPEEAEPQLQAEMTANLAAAKAYRSND